MKYPKFLALFVVIILTYLIFNNISKYPTAIDTLVKYLASFGLGVLYAYGFTSPIATGALLILSSEQNLFLTGIIAGFGSLVGDLIIFRFIRSSFQGELKKLSREKFMKKIQKIMNKYPKSKILIPITACIAIASPLPDEIGVVLFASYKDVTTKTFSIFSYILNTIGIFVILILGRNL